MRTSNPAHAGSLTLDTRLTMTEMTDMALNKIMVGQGPGSSPVEEDKPAGAVYGQGTVKLFDFTPGTGTGGTPANISDGAIGAEAYADALGEYVEVLYFCPLKITQWRQYGHLSNVGDGVFKLQYQNLAGAWVDWVTGISTRGASWSDWDSSGGEVTALGIRWVATTLDSAGDGRTRIGELEVMY